MTDADSIDELRDRGTGRRAPLPLARLYHQAFSEFGPACLWSHKELDAPTIAQAVSVAEALRNEGNLAARALAERIERACRAAL